MQIVYIPSESMSVQGKKDEIYKRYGKDWNTPLDTMQTGR